MLFQQTDAIPPSMAFWHRKMPKSESDVFLVVPLPKPVNLLNLKNTVELLFSFCCFIFFFFSSYSWYECSREFCSFFDSLLGSSILKKKTCWYVNFKLFVSSNFYLILHEINIDILVLVSLDSSVFECI